MTNEQEETIIQKCYAINAITFSIGQISLSNIVHIERIEKLKAARKRFVDELVDFIKQFQ